MPFNMPYLPNRQPNVSAGYGGDLLGQRLAALFGGGGGMGMGQLPQFGPPQMGGMPQMPQMGGMPQAGGMPQQQFNPQALLQMLQRPAAPIAGGRVPGGFGSAAAPAPAPAAAKPTAKPAQSGGFQQQFGGVHPALLAMLGLGGGR